MTATRKSRKSRNPGDRYENLEKIPSEKSRKSQNSGDFFGFFFGKSPGFGIFGSRDFFGIFLYFDFYPNMKTSKKSQVKNPENPEIPGFGIIFWVFGFWSPGFGIFLYFEIFIPGIWDCSPSGYPGRIFYLRNRDFFRGIWYFDEKPTLWYDLKKNYFKKSPIIQSNF